MANNASDVLKIARGELGYSRWNDPQTGTKYGRWYAQSHGSYFGKNGVPFCAMFASWVFNQAGAKCVGLPGAYTPTMLQAAQNKGKVRGNKRDAQPGDILYFNWDGGVVDHVGIVEVNKGSYVQTIEGNTGNGQVLRRTRSWGTIQAVVRPDYSSTSSSTTKPSSSSSTKLDVDGYAGTKTITRAQQIAGTQVDGEISNQDKNGWVVKQPQALATGVWKTGNTKVGSALVKEIQRQLNAKGYKLDVDGLFGLLTWHAFERNFGITPDDKMSAPSATIKLWQKKLNTGKLV